MAAFGQWQVPKEFAVEGVSQRFGLVGWWPVGPNMYCKRFSKKLPRISMRFFLFEKFSVFLWEIWPRSSKNVSNASPTLKRFEDNWWPLLAQDGGNCSFTSIVVDCRWTWSFKMSWTVQMAQPSHQRRPWNSRHIWQFPQKLDIPNSWMAKVGAAKNHHFSSAQGGIFRVEDAKAWRWWQC